MSGHGFRVELLLGAAGAAIWLLSMPTTARSAEQSSSKMPVACPLWLQPDAFKPDRSPAGWKAVMPQQWRLDGGGLLHGAPDESGYLKPYDAKITKKGDRKTGVTKWKLGPLPHSYETWLYCGYGPLQLFKRIPINATECTATSKLERGAFVETVFDCK